MEIKYPPNLLTTLKHRHLLIDTNVFRDAASKPSVFINFFNDLKIADITLVTVDAVKFELLKGSANITKFNDKRKFIDDIIDATLPYVPQTNSLIYELIEEYGIEGTSISITDLILGAMLKQYRKNLFLITRDTSDFLQNIFALISIVNAPHNKGIFTYGIYQYIK